MNELGIEWYPTPMLLKKLEGNLKYFAYLLENGQEGIKPELEFLEDMFGRDDVPFYYFDPVEESLRLCKKMDIQLHESREILNEILERTEKKK